MRSRKHFVVWLCSLLALLLVAGCGGAPAAPKAADQPAPAATQPAAQPATPPTPANPDLILATTTSTQDSGLLDVIVPLFETKTGYKVKTIAVGTGQALAMGDKGEADVLLVHAPADEKKLIEKGTAIERKLVMHNDFIVVGPKEDPAKVKGSKTAAEALKKIADAKAVFVSRGDDSGTHKKELSLWKDTGIKNEGAWYQQTGSGMGQTLNVANEKNGYTLTDRATYLANQKNLSLQIVLEGDAPLLNIYHVMLVNPAKFSKVNAEGAKAFSDYLLSAEGQSEISKFGKEKYGQSLFFGDGGKTEAQLTGQK
ncbi:MAG TPA: substrate-binding domain-containing protein [Symbiobacteriaceae bacterium]|jgi:tungstate transport system substrate-binding protein|nr:substrate-binding domain-containing protein [Symbiobacteriaceae bacterium]